MLLLFSRSVVSDSLGFPLLHCLPEFTQTHVHWVSDDIQPSHLLLPPSPPAFNISNIRVFPNESALHVSFSISPSNEYSGLISFRMNWFDLAAVQGTLKSLFQHHSLKALVLQCSAFFMVQLSHPYMTTGKTIVLIIQIFISKMMSLLPNTLSRFVIAFLPRSKHLLISWLQSLSTVILEPPKIKSVTISTFSPSICLEVMASDALILVFGMLIFKPAFSLSSFTFIKRLFSSSSYSAITVMSSAYLTLLFLLPILISACSSSRKKFHMMYSACKLNKQGDNIQLWCTPFQIWNQSIVSYLVSLLPS